MSPPSIRGLLISLKEAAIVVGILLGYLIGFLFFRVNGGWGYTYGFSSVVAIIMGVGGLFLKESSRWLYLKGYKNEAKNALFWVLKPHVAEETYSALGRCFTVLYFKSCCCSGTGVSGAARTSRFLICGHVYFYYGSK